ncbi:hypothetical protein [Sphingomicrobium astaxanthinifaciens]|uniref:hypothetical protein n=1 Tax=Sphingomicrobium astaxanthinifaciens TaxID=1227949 RepID=UPI001FCC5EC1|nr:hypothetical protein [Sphingomicrobium astaxanthinifaciens]MCJ7422190.1 hypothetical protein [Sphingomicrobium astaxanthinifaciens]
MLVALGLLPKAHRGAPGPAYLAAATAAIASLALLLAIGFFPRRYWGEYGHGDVFGMVFLMLCATAMLAASVGTSLLVAVVAWAGRHRRRNGL